MEEITPDLGRGMKEALRGMMPLSTASDKLQHRANACN
jgi:hypothetical protein